MTPHLKPSALPVLAYLQGHGWITTAQLVEACHATDADRRMRELRAAGYPIEKQRRYGPDGKALSTWEYRLAAGAIVPGGGLSPLSTAVSPVRPQQATLPMEVQGRPQSEYGPP